MCVPPTAHWKCWQVSIVMTDTDPHRSFCQPARDWHMTGTGLSKSPYLQFSVPHPINKLRWGPMSSCLRKSAFAARSKSESGKLFINLIKKWFKILRKVYHQVNFLEIMDDEPQGTWTWWTISNRPKDNNSFIIQVAYVGYPCSETGCDGDWMLVWPNAVRHLHSWSPLYSRSDKYKI